MKTNKKKYLALIETDAAISGGSSCIKNGLTMEVLQNKNKVIILKEAPVDEKFEQAVFSFMDQLLQQEEFYEEKLEALEAENESLKAEQERFLTIKKAKNEKIAAPAQKRAERLSSAIEQSKIEGNLTIREIAEDLTKKGYSAARGGDLQPSTIHRYMKRLGL